MNLLLKIFICSLMSVGAYLAVKFKKHAEKYDHITTDSIFQYVFLKPSEVCRVAMKTVIEKGGSVKNIIGFTARVVITDPMDVREIMTNSKFNKKASMYDFLGVWLGDGLITSNGNKWFNRRKILTNSFHFKILEGFVSIFDKNSELLVDILEQFDGQSIDIYPKVELCALDVLCETAMGVQADAQVNSDSDYVKAVKTVCQICAKRVMNPFLWLNWMFYLTPLYSKQKACLKILHNFTDDVIARRRKDRKGHKSDLNELDSNYDGGKVRKNLLDILLQSTIEGEPLSDLDIREEVDTFLFAGHGTTASAISFCLYSLAKHPEIQMKAVEELRKVFGDNSEKKVSIASLNELQYLDMIIRETLRLYPSVPFLGRTATEDIVINGKFIPKNTTLMMAPLIMARMASIWEEPEKFIPERFSPENIAKTSPFASISFSAGSRNCIGQKFAMLVMKAIVSKVLRKFEITVAENFEPILLADLTLSSENGIKIKLQKRQYAATATGSETTKSIMNRDKFSSDQ